MHMALFKLILAEKLKVDKFCIERMSIYDEY